MYLKNDKYEILITKIADIQNKEEFDIILNPENLDDPDYYCVFNIEVRKENKETKIALIGEYLSSEEDCGILNGNKLIILQNEMIRKIDIETNELIFSKQVDSFGCFFSIYEVTCGYIIHGELNIVKLNELFEKEWDFGSADIFVNIDGKKAFEIDNGIIKVSDWLDNYFELDLQGNVVYEK